MKTVLFCCMVFFAFVVMAAVAKPAITPDMTKELRRKEQSSTKEVIIDISHEYKVGMPYFFSGPHGVPPFFVPKDSIKRGDIDNTMNFTLNTHWGTHVDAPGHFNQTLLDEGYDVNHLDLTTLNGPCLVVDVPREKNITAEVLKELSIPRGIKRVLFKTLNTDRKLMYQTRFDSSYTGFTTDGAQYLVANTDIKLVGIDYLSVGIAVREELIGVHLAFLDTKEIIPVEDLKLDDVAPEIYTVHCLPLRLSTFDGSPARCILVTGRSTRAHPSAIITPSVRKFSSYTLFTGSNFNHFVSSFSQLIS